MPANKINQPVNTFVKGLITEASPLTFPENASLDEVNFKLNRDGSRDRRWGMQNIYREALPFSRVEFEKFTGKVFKWEQPKGARKSVIGVVQVGTLLYYVDLTTQPRPSAVLDDLVWYDDAIPLLNGGAAVDISHIISGTTPIEFAAINGYLLAINEEVSQPFLAWYDDDADTVYWDHGDILVRDIWGVDDDLSVDERPIELSELHRYNLMNQGFTNDIVTTCGTPILECIKTHFGRYPSNNDSWGVGRTADLTSADVYKFDPALAERNLVNNQPAAKGKFLIHVYYRGLWRSNQTGLTLPTDLEESFCTTVETYAGRAWYSGIRGKVLDGDERSPNLCQAVFFSQVMESPVDLVRCYQEADPTSYEFNEVVDTDGGVILINGCSFIHKIKAIKSSLWVFGDNGVWEIRGSGEQGFTATSFEVRKINSIGICAKDSVVDANGVIFYWAYSGIYAIQPDPNINGVYNTTNVTQYTIQTKYDDFDTYTKTSAKGIYDPYNNKIRWLYNVSEYGNIECNYQPFWLEVHGSPYLNEKYILFTHKDGINPDATMTYAYVFGFPAKNIQDVSMYSTDAPDIQEFSNGKLLTYTTITPPNGDLWAHTAIAVSSGTYTDNIYYFYVKDPTNALRVQKYTWNGETDDLSVSGSYVDVNTSCRNESALLDAKKLTDSKFIVAFHDTSNKASTQIVNSNLTYGTPLASTNTVASNSTVQFLSLVTWPGITSTKAALCYKDSVFDGCTIDYLSIATNTITLSSSTTFPNATQMPTGTTSFTRQRAIDLGSNKFLVCGLLTNATLGYTYVISCFIVTISGSTLSSTTILNLPAEVGTVDTRVIPIDVVDESDVIMLLYNTTVSGTKKIRYIKLDVSGTTPVSSATGDWITDIGADWSDYHVHANVYVDAGRLATAYRELGSLGMGGEEVYIGTIP